MRLRDEIEPGDIIVLEQDTALHRHVAFDARHWYNVSDWLLLTYPAVALVVSRPGLTNPYTEEDVEALFVLSAGVMGWVTVQDVDRIIVYDVDPKRAEEGL